MEFRNGTIATHNGKVTVTSPTGEWRTFQINRQSDDARFAPGKRVVALLAGSDNVNDYVGFGFVSPTGKINIWRSKNTPFFRAVARMLEEPESYVDRGVRYDFAEKCRFCNRELTTPASIHAGYGPTCADNHGLPYGETDDDVSDGARAVAELARANENGAPHFRRSPA